MLSSEDLAETTCGAHGLGFGLGLGPPRRGLGLGLELGLGLGLGLPLALRPLQLLMPPSLEGLGLEQRASLAELR